MAPSAKVHTPVLSILNFSVAAPESPVAKTKSVELTDEENVASASAKIDAALSIMEIT